MIVKKAEKQPREVKDFPVDYSPWLGENTPVDTLLAVISEEVACTTNEDDTSLVIVDVVISATGMVVWLSGGTDGETYKVTILLGTASSPQRRDECELIIKVVEV